MAANERYRQQVALLVRSLPAVAGEDCFALKGGTAIKLFVRDMPRLSVDIDLTFLPHRAPRGIAGRHRAGSFAHQGPAEGRYQWRADY